jgi:predicted RNase H-like HicB family nuclease
MRRRERSEGLVRLHIKRLPEGLYLATSNDVQGLVAQGRTIAETIEIARDVARRLLDAQGAPEGKVKITPTRDSFDYPLIVGL